uniref:ornithine decarboxylase-like n=1 Tax=Myxine glutinosa TaxID=7769 RepID=UPI00358F847D
MSTLVEELEHEWDQDVTKQKEQRKKDSVVRVKLFEYYEDNNRILLVMELAKRGNVWDLIGNSFLPEPMAKDIMRQQKPLDNDAGSTAVPSPDNDAGSAAWPPLNNDARSTSVPSPDNDAGSAALPPLNNDARSMSVPTPDNDAGNAALPPLNNDARSTFHVGSGCTDANTYTQAIADARCVFDMAKEFGYHLSLLDIGGGFPGCLNSKVTFEEIASVVDTGLESYFPADLGLRIIAEPGRFFMTSAFTLAVNVIAKRAVGVDGEPAEANGNEEPSFMYYLNDGVYRSFNCLLYDHAQVSPVVYKEVSDDEPVFASSLWGPTCDGLDCVLNQCPLPELNVGDWLIFPDMGAYTLVAASTFNGFPRPPVHCIITHSDWLMELCPTFSSVANAFMGFGCGGGGGPKVVLPPTNVEV